MNINSKTRRRCLAIKNNSLILKSRRFFSLLEMLIVMVIIAIAASLVAFKIVDLLKQQRFRTGSELILDKLSIAQNVMLIFSSEVIVTLSKSNQNDNLICTIEVKSGITPALTKIIGNSSEIKGVKFAKFESEGQPSQSLPISLRFNFLSFDLPKGRLWLSADQKFDKQSDLTRIIHLTGYPKPLGFQINPNKEVQNLELSELLYPQEIREEWLLQLQEETTQQNATPNGKNAPQK